MHKVVFVTLYYNRASEVDVTLTSMLAAKIDGVHIIAVDDGSTDHTYEELLKFKEYGVEVITGKNKGFSKCLYDVLDGVDSQYIAICGSGDICHKDRILDQIELMDNRPDISFCGTASRNIDIDSNKVVDIQKFSDGELAAQDFYESPPFTHGTVMIRTSAYKKVGGYDSRFYFCQDWDLWFRLLEVGKGYFINKNLYDRRLLLDGASFNAKKTEKQLVYKYLALFFFKNKNLDRDEYMNNLVLDKVIHDLNFSNEIRKDMSSRYIKLFIIRDFSGARELRDILNERYDGLLFKCLLIFYLIKIPVKYNIGVSFLSGFLRSGLYLFRKFSK